MLNKRILKIKIEFTNKRLEQLKKRLEQARGLDVCVIKKIETKIKKVVKKKEILLLEEEKIMKLFDKTQDLVEKSIINYRLIECRTWENISEKTGYSDRHCKRIFKKIIGDEK